MLLTTTCRLAKYCNHGKQTQVKKVIKNNPSRKLISGNCNSHNKLRRNQIFFTSSSCWRNLRIFSCSASICCKCACSTSSSCFCLNSATLRPFGLRLRIRCSKTFVKSKIVNRTVVHSKYRFSNPIKRS